MKYNFKQIATMFLALLFTHFFGAVSVKNNYLLLMLFPFVIDSFVNKNIFGKYIFMMILGIVFSIISSFYFRGQSVTDSFYRLVPYFFICFYFLLLRINLSIDKSDKIILYISLAFCLCYILQYIVYPVEIFKGAAARVEIEQDIRMRMFGQGFASLGHFYGLNKLIVKKKPIYILIILLCLGVIFLMGFRTMFVMIILCSFILIVRLSGFSIKSITYFALFMMILFCIVKTPIFASIIDRMIERNQTSNFSNRHYNRVRQYNYYTKDHFKNSVEYFFGSGLPEFSKGKYGYYMNKIIEQGLNYSDLGLLSLSWMVGIITVAAMLLYSLKAIRIKVDKKYYYISSWFIYLLSISLTTFEFVRFGNFIPQAICLYIVEKGEIKSKLE